MPVTALDIVSLDEIKRELRIGGETTESRAAFTAHNDLLAGQIGAAVAFVSREIDTPLIDEGETTGLSADDPALPALKAAAILVVRELYNGYREIRPTEAFYALIAPWRRYG